MKKIKTMRRIKSLDEFEKRLEERRSIQREPIKDYYRHLRGEQKSRRENQK